MDDLNENNEQVFSNDDFLVQRRNDGLVDISETARGSYAFNPEYIECLIFTPSEFREDQAFGELKFRRNNDPGNNDLLWEVSLSVSRENARCIAKVFGVTFVEYWYNKDGSVTRNVEEADA